MFLPWNSCGCFKSETQDNGAIKETPYANSNSNWGWHGCSTAGSTVQRLRSPNLRDLLVTAEFSSNFAYPQLPSGSFDPLWRLVPSFLTDLLHIPYFLQGKRAPWNLTWSWPVTLKTPSTWSSVTRCNLQYIGETKRRLKDRFHEQHCTIENPNKKSKSTTAAEHFLSSTTEAISVRPGKLS